MKKKKMLYVLIAILILTVGAYGIYAWRTIPGEYDDFAKCLSESGATKYGTDWCGYCKQQKALFGKSFKYVDYVNCDYNKDECILEGVTGYPTWKINGESYSGVQSFERLSQLTGCEL